MSKLGLTDPASLSDETEFLGVIESNNTLIEDAIENTLSRDGTSPNEMEADLDMNSNRILNLPEPATSSEPATKNYVDAVSALSSSAALTAAVTAAETAEANAEAAQAAAEAAVEGYRATSTTTLTPEIATKTFTIAAGKSFEDGDWILAKSDAAPTTVYMHGVVTDYTTTSLEVDVQTIGTATESDDWSIQISSPKGSTGAAGAAGADYTADAELNALAGLTATAGILTQTADDTFTTREVAGTADRIVVTNPAGVAGNITLNTGDDVLHRDVTNTISVGYAQTCYDHGSKSGVSSLTPLPSLGLLQKAAIAASAQLTINAPTAEEGNVMLLLTNSGAPTSVTFSSFDKTLTGSTFSLTSGKVHLILIYSINSYQIMNIQTIA